MERHFARRRAIDKQRLETMRSKGRRESMLLLVERNIQKDEQRCETRISKLRDRASFSPEVSEIGAGIISVEAPP